MIGASAAAEGLAGEDVGFAAVLSMDLDRAFRSAGAILGNEADAEDAVQTALERAWANWGRIRDPAAGRGWFWRILVNVCREQVRSRRRHPASVLDTALDEALAPPEADPFREALARDAVGRAMAALNEDQRVTIALRYWGELSVPEIAARLGIPEGTVKSRLHAAHAVLRRQVEGDGEGQR